VPTTSIRGELSEVQRDATRDRSVLDHCAGLREKGRGEEMESPYEPGVVALLFS